MPEQVQRQMSVGVIHPIRPAALTAVLDRHMTPIHILAIA